MFIEQLIKFKKEDHAHNKDQTGGDHHQASGAYHTM
jgi:hypothetical protein